MYPSDRSYTKDCLWLRVESGVATVGLTDYLVKMLNEVSAIELPDEGRSVARGAAFGTAEGLKSATDLVAPVSGVVEAVHRELMDSPARIEADPYGIWIVRLRVTDPSEVSALLSSVEFAEHLLSNSSTPEPDARQSERLQAETAARSPARPVPARSSPSARGNPPVPASPRVTIEPEKAVLLLWSLRLGNCRLRGGNSAFGDGDHSGGSYFSWRERDISFTSHRSASGGFDRRYQWRDTTHTRVSAGGLSSSTKSHADYAGTWEINVVGRVAYLVLQDRDRGRLRIRLEEGPRGAVLLDGRPYSTQRQ